MRRKLLVVASLASLLLLAYAGVSLALAVPVDDAMAAANELPGAPPLAGRRAVVVPLAAPEDVPTFHGGGDATRGHAGALLVVGRSTTGFPSGARDAALVRALAFVEPGPNGTYAPANLSLSGLPGPDANLTLDVASLAGGKAGFLAKGDAETEVRFVPASEVLGQVARVDTLLSLLALLALGIGGFVMPIVVLILTHRGAGPRATTAGAPPPTGGLCRECRRPLEQGAAFCAGCGAWVDRDRAP